MTHVIVTDLGYGDAGKGSVTDWLCSPRGASLRGDRPIAHVVRYNGGAQAAHNVTDGRRWHTFAQFGSGTFRGVPTFLSRYMLADPLALAAEEAHLAEIGYGSALDLITVDRDALIITPYHVMANKARELARGDARHGTCGKGIGETARFALDHPDLAIRAGDCAGPAWLLTHKLRQVRQALADDASTAGVLTGPRPADLADAYRAFAERVTITDGSLHLPRLLRAGPVVFEGAQGVLLDERYGFHPYTTWSVTTSANAEALLAEAGEEGYRLGVIRSYMTRHGPGPLVTEDPALDFPEPHNGGGGWQGAFRQGHPDLVALDYAVRANGGIDGLAVTHLDAGPDVRLPLKLCLRYRAAGGGAISRMSLFTGGNLRMQEQLTRILMQAAPVYAEARATRGELLRAFSETAGAPAVLGSYGPEARDKVVMTALIRR